MQKRTFKPATVEELRLAAERSFFEMALTRWERSIEIAEFEWNRWQMTGNKKALIKANEWVDAANHAAVTLCGHKILPHYQAALNTAGER